MFGLVSKSKYNQALNQLSMANDTIVKLQTRTAKKEPKTDEPISRHEVEVPKVNARTTASAIRKEQAIKMSQDGMHPHEIASNLGVKDSTIETYLREGKNANKGQN